MSTMKARSVAAAGILICMSLFVTATSAGRPVVEQQQKDSAAQVQLPDWLGFPFLPPFHWPPFHWPGRGHFSPAPHSAPSNSHPKFPKWPFPAHPPFPHFPIPKHPPATTSSLSAAVDTNQGDSNNAHPDFFPLFSWYWMWLILHGGHSSPSPHSAPSHTPPKWPFPAHPPFPHFPVPKKPPTTTSTSTSTTTSLGLEAAASQMIAAASAAAANHKCWSPLSHFQIVNCVNDITSAFTTGQLVQVNAACCSAIKNMEKDCQDTTIGSFDNQRFTSAITDYCSAI